MWILSIILIVILAILIIPSLADDDFNFFDWL